MAQQDYQKKKDEKANSSETFVQTILDSMRKTETETVKETGKSMQLSIADMLMALGGSKWMSQNLNKTLGSQPMATQETQKKGYLRKIPHRKVRVITIALKRLSRRFIKLFKAITPQPMANFLKDLLTFTPVDFTTRSNDERDTNVTEQSAGPKSGH